MKNPQLSTASIPVIDWNRTRQHFDAMSESEVYSAINDLLATLGPAMTLDVADNGGRQGFYMDVLSVARQSLAERS